MPFQNIPLSTLRTYVTSRLQNPYFWSALEVQVAINDAILSLQLATGLWQGRFVVSTVAGRSIYNIGSLAQLQVGGVTQLLMPLRMAFNSAPLDPTSTDDLDNGYPQAPGWQLTTTATPGAPTTPTMWAPIGISYFALYPADAVGGNSLQIDGIIRSPTLVQESDFINIDTSQIPALVGECLATLAFKRGGIALQKALAGHRDFVRMCAQINSHIKAMAPFRKYMAEDASRRTRRRDTIQPVGLGAR